jgi:hypothetical protein
MNRIVGFFVVSLDAKAYRFRVTVEKSSSHHLSQAEIASDNPCSQQLSGDKVRHTLVLVFC